MSLRFAVLLLPLCSAALVADNSQADDMSIDGVWRGAWYLGMSSGSAELVLRVDSGSPVGSLQLVNNESFGSAPGVVKSAKYLEGAVTLSASGEGGQLLEARLLVDKGKESMKGPALVAGYKLRIELRKAH
jgi:hypothetical protein